MKSIKNGVLKNGLSKTLLIALTLHLTPVGPVFASNPQTGIAVRKVFVDLLDATQPQLSTTEKKQRISGILFQSRELLVELFFKNNRDVWADANLRMDYDRAVSQLKLAPLLSGVMFVKNESDQNPFLSYLKQGTQAFVQPVATGFLHFLPAVPKPIGDAVLSLPLIREITDNEVNVLSASTNEFISHFNLKDSSFEKELFDPIKGFNLDQLPENSREQFIDALQNFINNLPFERKRAMARIFLELPPDASLGKIVASTSVYAGPIFVKLLQLLRNFSSAEMQNELKVLLDKLPPHLSREEIQNIMRDSVSDDLRDRIVAFSETPINVASLGQIHKMTLELASGKRVDAIIKFLAPKFKEMVEQDLENFEKVMGGFQFGRKMVSSMRSVMSEELNLEQEASYTEFGALLYRDPVKGIDVVNILRGDDFVLNRFMEAQTFAAGTSLARITPEVIEKSGVSETDYYIYLSRALVSYSKKWFQNAIFGQLRLAHADSHKGNLFFNIELDKDPGLAPYRLTVIDFGSMCRFTQEEAKAIVLIGQGLVLFQTSDILAGLQKLNEIAKGGELDAYDLARLGQLKDYIELNRKNYVSMHDFFTQISIEAIKLQIEFPTSFLQFNRGRILLEDVTRESLEHLKESSDPRAQEEYHKLLDSFEVYMAIAVKSVVIDLGWKLASFGLSESLISTPTVLSGASHKCFDIASKCLREGPSKVVQEELYPLYKNLLDVLGATLKDLAYQE